jgi:hypothetical protein
VSLGFHGWPTSPEQVAGFAGIRIDTGSSNCIFARSVGEELGLDIESGLRLLVGTVTGNFVAYLHEVDLSLASFEFSGLVGFAADQGFRRNVLGRRGFIEQLTLGLVDYEGKLFRAANRSLFSANV